jgi:PST family polysaccharide transporter
MAFGLRMGSMVVLARLLAPTDFGLVGMVTAFTGFLGLFRDAGLSMATVQQGTVTAAQTSTLFWINVIVGGGLALLCCAAAPVMVWFYGEPHLLWVALVLSIVFVFNGIGAQHRAMLQRNMRFQPLALIDTAALVVSIATGIGAALVGAGYWAIVAMTVVLPAAGAAGVWLASRWIPGRPRRGAGVRGMLRYGGTLTVNSVIMYFAYNMDKVLLGRFWGAEALGIYGRAYQLVNIPTENMNFTLGLVAFPALARMQDEPKRLKEYFLKGYGLFLAITIPITASCLLFADDIVRVLLGPKWAVAAGVFRLLAPTTLVLAFINPLAWLMLAAGHALRSLKIAMIIAPVVMIGYSLGLGGGPTGVALGLSVAMVVLVVPVMMWAKAGTLISGGDIAGTVMRPLVSAIVGGVAAYGLRQWVQYHEPPLLRLIEETSALFCVYAVVLLVALRQGAVYAPVLRHAGVLRGRLASGA